ncbi:hypothetical protein QPK87_28910 [Kamptonema cortianum]|jgi:hypothetical protein|nr:hypothetical protein [Kamptonema cortianum]
MSEISPVHDELDDQSTIYYFASGINPGEGPLVELTKSWPQGQQSLIVGRYDQFQEALDAEMELVDLKADQGLEAAMREAERRAVEAGELDPARADGRLFTDGPLDPFTTLREQELQGLHYTYDIVAQSQGTVELQSIKTWEVDGERGLQAIALGEYDRSSDARAEQEMLQTLGKERGLEAEMREVERIAVENGVLDDERADPRLFTEGPPDPFKTERQEALEANMGYYFRAGPALDQGETVAAYSLNLVNVEREGAAYRFSQVEYLRVEVENAGYVDDAADKFNHLMGDHGVGPAVSAANTWAREHSAQPALEWQEVEAAQLDRQHQPTTPTVEMDTQPLPAVTRDEMEL